MQLVWDLLYAYTIDKSTQFLRLKNITQQHVKGNADVTIET